MLFSTHPIYTILAEAEACTGNAVPEGERREVIVFTPCTSKDEAASNALMFLSQQRWTGCNVVQVQRLLTLPNAVKNAQLHEAAHKALAGEQAYVLCSVNFGS